MPPEDLEISEQMGVIPPSQFSRLHILVPRPHFGSARASHCYWSDFEVDSCFSGGTTNLGGFVMVNG